MALRDYLPRSQRYWRQTAATARRGEGEAWAKAYELKELILKYWPNVIEFEQEDGTLTVKPDVPRYILERLPP